MNLGWEGTEEVKSNTLFVEDRLSVYVYIIIQLPVYLLYSEAVSLHTVQRLFEPSIRCIK